MTALFRPSMPIEIAPLRLTLAFSISTTRKAGFFSLALIAAIGPPVPPPITSRSVSMISVFASGMALVMPMVRREEHLAMFHWIALGLRGHPATPANAGIPKERSRARDRRRKRY